MGVAAGEAVGVGVAVGEAVGVGVAVGEAGQVGCCKRAPLHAAPPPTDADTARVHPPPPPPHPHPHPHSPARVLLYLADHAGPAPPAPIPPPAALPHVLRHLHVGASGPCVLRRHLRGCDGARKVSGASAAPAALDSWHVTSGGAAPPPMIDLRDCDKRTFVFRPILYFDLLYFNLFCISTY